MGKGKEASSFNILRRRSCGRSALMVLAPCLLLKDPTHASFVKPGVAQFIGAIGSRAGVGWLTKRAQNKPAMRGMFSRNSTVTNSSCLHVRKFCQLSSNRSTAAVLQLQRVRRGSGPRGAEHAAKQLRDELPVEETRSKARPSK